MSRDLGHVWANNYGTRIDLTDTGDELVLSVDLPKDILELRINRPQVRDLRLKLIKYEKGSD